MSPYRAECPKCGWKGLVRILPELATSDANLHKNGLTHQKTEKKSDSQIEVQVTTISDRRRRK